MIKSFYVQNHCSIKDRISISFEANNLADQTSFENVFNYKNSRMLKVFSFYGANASGKSSIIKALAALKEIALSFSLNGVFILPYSPFEFTKESLVSPTYLGIEFSMDEYSPIYRYEVSYNKDCLLFEKLSKFSSQKPSLLFERSFDGEASRIRFGSSVEENPLLQQLGNSLIKDKSFLSMFTNINIVDFYDVYHFFSDRLVNITPEVTRYDDYSPSEFKTNDKLKAFSENLLKAADFDIDGIDIKKKPIKMLSPIPGFVVPELERETLVFNHKGAGCGGQIEFIKESLGTKKILVLAAQLYKVLAKQSVLIVDELESSLHPDLAKLIIEIFLDDSINKYNSQLIFTSHNAALLDLNIFRREQINFVYKNKKDCSTFVRSLKDFHVRKNDSIDKSYLAGRYLTSPKTNTGFLQ